MFTKEYQGIRWGYAFMKSDSRLSEEERTGLLELAIDMNLVEKKKMKIKGERLEGTVKDSEKYGQIGSFCGREYVASIDVQQIGRLEVRFLIDERTNGKFSPSMN